MKRVFIRALTGAILVMAVACGESPIEPTPPGNQPPPPPPTNTAPVIESIAVQGTRRNEPANFGDVSETLDVSAVVRDQETPVDQLQYVWTATLGTFSGTGARVSWRAPDTIAAPTTVTLTLEVVETYGTNLQNRVSRTANVSLHDSMKEVGDMSRQFLLDFSDTNIKDAAYIMRNFGTAATCPTPSTVEDERADVVRNYTDYRMMDARVGTPIVTVNFGGKCPFRAKLGDACAVVPVYWDSVKLSTNTRGRVEGFDIIAASYSATGSRWWLCASDFDGRAASSSAMMSYTR